MEHRDIESSGGVDGCGRARGIEFAANKHGVAGIDVEEVVKRPSEAIANEKIIRVLPHSGVAARDGVRYGYRSGGSREDIAPEACGVATEVAGDEDEAVDAADCRIALKLTAEAVYNAGMCGGSGCVDDKGAPVVADDDGCS